MERKVRAKAKEPAKFGFFRVLLELCKAAVSHWLEP